MLLDSDVAEFLEHHGIKGQRWGVRRARLHTQGRVERAVNRKIRAAGEAHRARAADPAIQARNKKLKKAALFVGVGAGVAAGLVFAAKNQNVKRYLSMSSNKLKIQAGNIATQRAIKDVGKVKMRDVPKPHVASPEHQRIMKEIAQKQLRTIAASNQLLRSMNNDLDVPIKDREYLDPTYWNRIVGK